MNQYGLLNKAGREAVPLIKEKIVAKVIDFIAEIELTQIYENTKESSIEVVYEVLHNYYINNNNNYYIFFLTLLVSFGWE